MLLNVVSEEAGHRAFNHLNIIQFQKVPFKPPSDSRILVILLLMDLCFCFPAVCQAFWNINGRFERRFNHKI